MNYGDRVGEAERLLMLQLLESSPNYTLADDEIESRLRANGPSPSHQDVTAHLSWLEDQGLVTIVPFPALKRVVVSRQGLDVAAGRREWPGVARISPTEAARRARADAARGR